VQRYLADEPVLACPPSAWYRFFKFARRNKAALATAVVVTMPVSVTVAVLVTSMVLIAREQQATQTAQQAEARAEEDRKKAVERERRESYFHRITLAHRDLVLELLAQCPEDLREWEWHYLMRLCRVEPLVLRDKTEVNGVAFSPDGERLASAGGDGAVKIRNSKTGAVVQTFTAHTDSVVSVAFHPDGKHLASVGADRQVKVWDLTTEQEVFNGPCDALRKFGAAYTVAFRPPDGRQLAAGSEGAVRVWDWKNRQLLYSFPGHEHHSISLAFSLDGRRLASGSWREGVRLWDTETGGLPLRTIPGHRHPVTALAFSPEGGRLASASFDRSVKLWDTTTGGLLHTLLHAGNVECVAFSPDGRRLASASSDGTIRLWDATPLRGTRTRKP
jgi:WD40 repeat protein